MVSSLSFFLLSFIFSALLGRTHAILDRHHSSTNSTSHFRMSRKALAQARRFDTRDTNNCGKKFKLVDMYKGQAFLDEWDFFTAPDPTHGAISYQSKQNAIKKGLAFVQADGTTVLSVDDKTHLPPGALRDSVRITSKKKYNGGLFIADIFAMPHGCSVWPAYWSVGPNWPTGGEIDVLEGTQDVATNQYTLHTSNGCTLSTGNIQTQSRILGKQCASSPADNSGCAFLDSDSRTYGHGFNLQAGGVYAHLWDQTGIKVWHFARPEIPKDIQAKKPNPASWPRPNAFFAASSCNMNKHFFDHQLVINTALCGDFAGATFNKLGCSGKCTDLVADPSNYKFAKWKLNYIAVYQ